MVDEITSYIKSIFNGVPIDYSIEHNYFINGTDRHCYLFVEPLVYNELLNAYILNKVNHKFKYVFRSSYLAEYGVIFYFKSDKDMRIAKLKRLLK